MRTDVSRVKSAHHKSLFLQHYPRDTSPQSRRRLRAATARPRPRATTASAGGGEPEGRPTEQPPPSRTPESLESGSAAASPAFASGPASAPASTAASAPASTGGPASAPASGAAWQVCVVVLQSGVDGVVQSASTLQPPSGSHVPFVLHAAGTAHRAAVAHGARTVAVGVAALVVVRVAHAAHAHERPGRRGARPVQRRVRMRGIARNGAAVGDLRRARVRALVAPVPRGAVAVGVAAAGRARTCRWRCRRRSGTPSPPLAAVHGPSPLA